MTKPPPKKRKRKKIAHIILECSLLSILESDIDQHLRKEAKWYKLTFDFIYCQTFKIFICLFQFFLSIMKGLSVWPRPCLEIQFCFLSTLFTDTTQYKEVQQWPECLVIIIAIHAVLLYQNMQLENLNIEKRIYSLK